MSTTFFVYPYNSNSAGAIMLTEELEGKRVKLEGSSYKYKPEHVLINWGNGVCPFREALNARIMDVIDKRAFFSRLQNTGLTPPFATTRAGAERLRFPVVCRQSLEGHDGEGIVIAETPAQLVNARLYTQYIDKTSEYRIHVGRQPNGEIVIIARQKKFKTEHFRGDGRIWTGDETKLSFIDLAPEAVIAVARRTFQQFAELTFAALDIVYDNSTEQAYVLEANSAPMMTTETTKRYADFLRLFAVGKPQPKPEAKAAPVVADQRPEAEAAPAPANNGLYGFVQAQLKAGHITKAQLEKAWTPPKPSEKELIENYVKSIS